jgi:FkbM family methyltransferase
MLVYGSRDDWKRWSGLPVFDLGMNEGQDTEYYLHAGHRVLAVEANKSLAESNARKFADAIGRGQLLILNVGVAESDGFMDFWICDDKSEWSSFDRTMAATNGSRHHSERVEVLTFDRIIKEFGVPHYLKVDIEGKEHACLDRIGPELPEYVSLEAYSELDLQKLADLGYRQFKCISQYYYLSLEADPQPEELRIAVAVRRNTRGPRGVLNKVRLRLLQRKLRFLDGFRFSQSSSGPFGRASRGTWKSHGEMLQIYRRFKQEVAQGRHVGVHCGTSPGSFWLDFHGKRS